MDKIKEAFDKVKQDISELHNQLLDLRLELSEMKQIISSLSTTNTKKSIKDNQLGTTKEISTHQHIIPTHPVTPTQTPTLRQEIEGLYYPNLGISIGNQGVPTDRQTDQQTIQQIIQHMKNKQNNEKSIDFDIKKASELIDSLDDIKKEIRRKFKKLTPQEMLVFSTIYQLEEHFPDGIEYKQLAVKLGLSQSSIRDYIQRIINKGIPVIKAKVDNKKIFVSVSLELKKIASLNTILQLRVL